MTEAQKRFCDEYLIDLNASRAYKVAYKNCKSDLTARTNGSKLLTNTNVQAYIAQKQKQIEKRTEVTQDRIIKELANIAFTNGTDFAQIVEEEKTEEMYDCAGNYIGTKTKKNKYLELTNTENLTEAQKSAIAGIKQTSNGIEIKTNDKVKALELLGKHLGMFKETNININTSYEEYLKKVDGDEY